MGRQEQVTSNPPGSEPGAPADPGAGRPGRGLGTWFRTRSRAARLVLTGTAAVTVALIAAIALSATSGGAPRPATPQRPAPAFTLAQLGHPGQQISLASYAGHPLIINFFASWCTPCREETPLIARYYRSAHGRVTIIGLDTSDSTAKGEAFVRQAGVRYPVASAPINTALAYQAPVLPVTFFLNARHRIVKAIYGKVTVAELNSGVAAMSAGPGQG